MNKKELRGKQCYEATHYASKPCTIPLDVCPMQEILHTSKIATVENQHFECKNDKFEVEVSVHPIKNKEGKIVQAIRIDRDIMVHKKTEEALKITAKIFDLATDSIFVADMKGNIVSFNEAAYKSRGYTKEELAKMKIHDLNAPEFAVLVDPINEQLLERGVDVFESVHVCKDGTLIPVEINVRIIDLEDKKLTLAVARDISERKLMEEERNRLIYDLYERIKELNCLYGMSKIFDKSDISLDDALQETVSLLPPAMQYPDIACARITIENQEFSTKNFEQTSWKLQADINVLGKKVGFLEVCYSEERPTISEGPFLKEEKFLLDIVAERLEKTIESNKSRTALAESEAKYRALVENADDAILLSDLSGKSIFKNRAYFKNLGFEENEVAEAEEFAKIHPDDLASVKENANQLLITGYSTSEYRVKHRNGSWVYRHARSTLIYNQRHQPYAILSIISDVSELKIAEHKLKESNQKIQLMNEKLRVVGGLTRHDVRNKLSAVNAYAYLIRKKHPDQKNIVEGIDKIEQAVRESMKIFDFAKLYEQLGVTELKYVDVADALKDAEALFSGLNLKVFNECRGLTVLADSFLRQLFFNLIDNTLKYGKKATTVRVYYKQAETGELHLIYEDDGVGISVENKRKLFTEGFSTGGSTGFGLFFIKKMMDIYGWTITEEGEAGKGVKFVMLIPVTSLSGNETNHIALKLAT
jgi:PAS domain S-box-containing protein